QEWYQHGLLHRDTGPAIIDPTRHMKEWWVKGKRHRVGAPAVEYEAGKTEWYLNGLRHREDGYAVEYPGAGSFWYYHSHLISALDQTDFEYKIDKLKRLQHADKYL